MKTNQSPLTILTNAYRSSHTAGRKLLALQIVAHVALLVLLVNGTWLQWLGCLVAYTLYMGIGMSITYHRLLSHRAFECPLWFERFGTLCGVIGALGSPITFVSQHREHHRYLDKPRDAYSLVNNPWWFVQWFTMLKQVSLKRAPELLRDPFCLFTHKHFFTIHIAYAFLLLLIDPFAVVYFYLAPVALTWNAANALNSIAHQPPGINIGYRHKGQTNSSVCVPFLGVVCFGEGWHSNHHYDVKNPKVGKAWWEIDIGYWIIKLVRTR